MNTLNKSQVDAYMRYWQEIAILGFRPVKISIWEFIKMDCSNLLAFPEFHCSSDSSGSIVGDLPEPVVDPHYHTLWAIE